MRRFLRETWELWYWAMFCPSKLQQRMNEWSPKQERNWYIPDTSFQEIILSKLNIRFVYQYIFILFVLSLPLILIIWSNGILIDMWLVPIVLMVTFQVGLLVTNISFSIPNLVAIMYWVQPNAWFFNITQLIEYFAFLRARHYIALLIFFVVFIITVFIEYQQRNTAENRRKIYAFLPVFFVLISWAYFDLYFVLLITLILFFGVSILFIIYGGFLFVVDGGDGKTSDPGRLIIMNSFLGLWVSLLVFVVVGFRAGLGWFGVGSILTGIISGFFSWRSTKSIIGIRAGGWNFVVLIGVVWAVEIGTRSPLYLFLVACGLVAFTLSSARRSGLVVIGILTILGIESLDWLSLWVVPVSFVTYYRLLPDYLAFCPGILLSSIPLIHKEKYNPFQLLLKLPPHTSELLWLPLPNHDRILAAAFQTNPSEALETFEKMQAIELPGFQITLKNALPQIIADRLAATNTTTELIATASPEHPLLPLLIPSFYSSNTEPIPTPATIRPEISILFPRLQSIAQDVEAALEPKSAALRERGLERILNNLASLQAQLPGLGLKPKAREQWQPVLQRWQRIIELELETQQQQSIGELLNPFLYGNPLKRDRPDIFKGRQTFADEIVRQIVDRNRPTLVLHGPRRCGKTSFLYNLPRLLPSDLLPIFVDMQSAAATQNDASFCYALVRAIAKDSRSQGVKFPELPPRQDFRGSPYIALEDWFERALPKLGDRRLLLNLDEFEKIGAAIHAGKLSLQLFDQLRHLIQHYDALGFLFCGVQTLDELGPNWSSYFISVVPMEMLYLEPEEAAELLVNPDLEFQLRYDTGIVDTVVALTRSHPYLVQLLGSAMVMEANQHQTTLITPDLLEAAIDRALTLGEPYFTNVWTEFTGTTPEMVAAGQELLIAIAQNCDISTPNPALARLLRYHILEPRENGEYDFEVPLLKRWVRERAFLERSSG